MYPDAFDQKHLRVEETDYLFVIGGAGPPLLLLHGFPQTHLCGDLVTPALGENRTVIAPDLRCSLAPTRSLGDGSDAQPSRRSIDGGRTGDVAEHAYRQHHRVPS
jgi:haloacetate dehalogenase